MENKQRKGKLVTHNRKGIRKNRTPALLAIAIILLSLGAHCTRSDSSEDTEAILQLYLMLNKGSSQCEITGPQSGEPIAYTEMVLIRDEPRTVPFSNRVDGSWNNDLHGTAKAASVTEGISIALMGDVDKLTEVVLYETENCPLERGITPELQEERDYTEAESEDGLQYVFHDKVDAVLYMVAPSESSPEIQVKLKSGLQ